MPIDSALLVVRYNRMVVLYNELVNGMSEQTGAL
jgi:hypothetical protein